MNLLFLKSDTMALLLQTQCRGIADVLGISDQGRGAGEI